MTDRSVSRRTLGFGLAATVSASLLGAAHAGAQATPTAPQPAGPAGPDPLGLAAQIAAVPPADLLARLRANPLSQSPFLLFGEFTPAEWPDPAATGLATGTIGGVLYVTAGGSLDDQNDVLGGILVFPDSAQATASHQAYASRSGADGRLVFPTQIAGTTAFTSIASGDYAETIGLLGNVVIFAADIFLTDGTRLNADDSVFRSTVYAVALLDHLTGLTRPSDTV